MTSIKQSIADPLLLTSRAAVDSLPSSSAAITRDTRTYKSHQDPNRGNIKGYKANCHQRDPIYHTLASPHSLPHSPALVAAFATSTIERTLGNNTRYTAHRHQCDPSDRTLGSYKDPNTGIYTLSGYKAHRHKSDPSDRTLGSYQDPNTGISKGLKAHRHQRDPVAHE